MSSSRFVVGFVAGAAASLSLVYVLSYCYGKQEEARSSDDEGGRAVADDPHGDDGKSKGMIHLPSALSVEKLLHSGGSSGTDKNGSFFSDLIHELWDHIDVFLSSMIRETVEPTLSTTLPAPLSSLRFTKLSLGQAPIRLENVVVAHHSDQRCDVKSPRLSRSDSPVPVKVYMDVAWHARCDIRLEGSMGITMGVEEISLHGKLACLVHPMSASPIVSAVNVSFVNVPTIDLNFTGLAAVADVQMIKCKVIQNVQQSMADVMVLPNSMVVRVDPAARFVDLYNPPQGILHSTLVSGKGFQVEKRLMFGRDDVVDVYCVLSLGSKTWTSATVDNCLSPTWNETVDFLYHDPEQILTIHAWDRDQGALDSDDHLGVAFVKVNEALSASHRAMHVELVKSATDATKTGIVLTVQFESVALTSECSSVTTSTLEPNRIRGILEILVVGARDLPIPKSSASTYVKVKVGAQEFVTCTVADAPGVDANNPQYDGGFVVAPQSPDDVKGDVVLTVYNEQVAIGSHSVPIRSLLDLADPSTTQSVPLGKSGGTLEFCAWIRGTNVAHGGGKNSDESRLLLPSANQSPVPSPNRPSRAPSNDTSASTNTAEPTRQSPSSASTIPKSIITRKQSIGKVRVTAVKGFGFKPHRGFFRRVDVPSVYCQLSVDGASDNDERAPNPWRSKAIRNSVNPEWDESSVLPFYDEHDVITICVCDEDRSHLADDGDDVIGSGRISIRTAVEYCSSSSSASKKQRRPVDVTISRRGKGTVAFIAIVVERI
jgi:Ca2+-dependent lipid-binding protein